MVRNIKVSFALQKCLFIKAFLELVLIIDLPLGCFCINSLVISPLSILDLFESATDLSRSVNDTLGCARDEVNSTCEGLADEPNHSLAYSFESSLNTILLSAFVRLGHNTCDSIVKAYDELFPAVAKTCYYVARLTLLLVFLRRILL